MKKHAYALLLSMLTAGLGVCPVFAEALPQEAITEDLEADVYDEEAFADSETDWSVFIVEQADQYVTLGDYKGLDVEEYIYTVTDEDVSIELDNRLYFSSKEVDVDRPAETGDTLYVDLTSTVDGETNTDEDFPFDLGYEQFGEEFDTYMEGAEKGQTLTFSISFEDDFDYSDWAGKSVSFSVSVNRIQALVQPDFTDAWVQENSDLSDTDAYLELLRADLQADSDQESADNAASAAFLQAMENASFTGYPQALFDAVYDQAHGQYEITAEMFGLSLEELFESYEMTEDDLKEQALEEVNSYLFMSAVAQAEGLAITDEDLQEFAEVTYESYGYDSADELLSYSDRDEMTLLALMRKVSYFILDQSHVTQSEYAYTDEDLIAEEDDDWDDADYEDDDDFAYYDDEDYEYDEDDFDQDFDDWVDYETDSDE